MVTFLVRLWEGIMMFKSGKNNYFGTGQTPIRVSLNNFLLFHQELSHNFKLWWKKYIFKSDLSYSILCPSPGQWPVFTVLTEKASELVQNKANGTYKKSRIYWALNLWRSVVGLKPTPKPTKPCVRLFFFYCKVKE